MSENVKNAPSGSAEDRGRIGLVVRLQPRGLSEHLAVEPVLHPVLDGHDDGLVHLVADDIALPDLASSAVDLRRLRSGGRRHLVCHLMPSLSILLPASIRLPRPPRPGPR